jgi:hypothetical protein
MSRYQRNSGTQPDGLGPHCHDLLREEHRRARRDAAVDANEAMLVSYRFCSRPL